MKPAPFAFSPPGRALCRFALDPTEAEARFGEPHYRGEGPRSLPAWGFEFECGLTIEIQLNAERSQGLLLAELRELEHALRHLGLDEKDIEWRMDEDAPAWARALEEYHPCAWGRWTVAVPNSEGELEPVAKCLSPADAQCQVDALAAEGKEAVIEEEPLSKARARRRDLASRRPAKRRDSGPQAKWEIWKLGENGSRTLVDLQPNQDAAEKRQRELTDRDAGRFEIKPRT